MPETTQFIFTHKEVVQALLARQNITSGIWGLYLKFGIAATNIGPSPSDLNPAAIVPVLEIGLQRFEEVNNLSVDASRSEKKVTKLTAKHKR